MSQMNGTGRLKAVLWDVDGTLAETERDGHRVAFNLAFEALGLPWRWDEARYGTLLGVTGGRERLMHDMTGRSDAPALADERQALAQALHTRKNVLYGELVRAGGIPLRPGVADLMTQCLHEGVRMGIVTTTSRANVEALLGVHLGAGWRTWFDVVVCGEDVAAKKPDPEAYLKALAALRLGPLATLALEDSPGGVAAACTAEVPVVVTRSVYFEHATIEGAIAIGPGLHQRAGWHPPLPDRTAEAGQRPVTLEDLVTWHVEAFGCLDMAMRMPR